MNNLALVNNFAMTKKFLITKVDSCQTHISTAFFGVVHKLSCQEEVGRYNSANLAHLLKKWAKWAELAVLQNGPQDFDFFNCHGCRLFISCEKHCDLGAAFYKHINSSVATVRSLFTKKTNVFFPASLLRISR